MSLFGIALLTGCAPSRYDYEYGERYRERESRAYFQDEQRQTRRARAKTRAQAQARAKARQERAAETERKQAETKTAADKEAEPSRDAETPREEPVAAASAARSSPPAVAAAPAITPNLPQSAKAEEAKSPDGSDEAARAESRKQIEDGYRLLRAGFVKKARERFERAMGANAPDASLAQGRSMDPSYLKTVAFPDVIPDAEQARRMYRRAILLGNSEAKSDLERLERTMAAAAPTSLLPATPDNAEPSGETPKRAQ